MSTINASNLASSWASSIFSKLDTSNQGYIDKSTLQSAFDSISSSSNSSSSSSTSSVDSLFSSIDSDSDGKITKSELTSSLEKLASQLNNAFDQMRMGGGQGGPGGMPGAGGPPPGPPPSDGNSSAGGTRGAQDSGFTKDELTQQLSDIGTSDSQRSKVISDVISNFDKADTNGDGKVDGGEAMALEKSLSSSSSSSSSSSGASSSSDSSSSGTSSSDAAFMAQMMKLTQAYGMSGDTGFSLLANSLSVSA